MPFYSKDGICVHVNVCTESTYILKRVYKYIGYTISKVWYITPIIRTNECAVALRLREVEPRDNQK